MILTLGDSRTGLVRKVNEDAINLDVENVYILADGMGGYEGGQIASTLAVESAGNFLERLEPAELSESNLKESILLANQAILDRKQDDDQFLSMGTTMIAASVIGDTLNWAHVGDSRLYVWHDNILKQITTDHSFVMELVNEGKISREDMRFHPRKNEITRAVGIEKSLTVDTGHFKLDNDSLVLLCSDGLTGMIDDNVIRSVIADNPRRTQDDLKKLDKDLTEKAYDAGAKDNVSLILVQFTETLE